VRIADRLAAMFRSGGKLLLFGNGGSAAEAQGVATEFTGRFVTDRRPLPAIALSTDTSALTAIGNDYGFETVFARQIAALARPGDIVYAISTSGRSPNVLAGVRAASEAGLESIGLPGRDGGPLASLVTWPLVVPAPDTARIQEVHLMAGHTLVALVEQRLFGL
jgi:D-sedoheptulose 7-phosphate isomerase